MKVNIIYDKKTEQISAYSERKIETPQEQVELNLTDDEYQKFKDNWKPFYRNGKLEFEKPAWKEGEDKKIVIEKLKNDIQSATTVAQVKTILKDLLNNLG